MKEIRKTEIPTFEELIPIGKRFNFNKQVVTIDDEDFFSSEFVTVENFDRKCIIPALIKRQYAPDDEAAIARKVLAQEPGATEQFEQYNDFVNTCKQIADEALTKTQ